jgi:hypothetical protein
MRKFRNTRRDVPAEPTEAPEEAVEPAVDSKQTVARVTQYTSGGDDAQPGTEILATASQPSARDELAPDYGQLGEHISSVVQAASEAAKKIEEDARNRAERLRDRTQKQAATMIEEARREAEKLRFEAERLRAEAEIESKETRERADAYATEKRRDAEAEAAAVVARGEQVAKARASAADERYRTLEANVELTEERLHQLVAGLLDTASRLKSLAERPETRTGGEEAVTVPDEEASLDEALSAAVNKDKAD